MIPEPRRQQASKFYISYHLIFGVIVFFIGNQLTQMFDLQDLDQELYLVDLNWRSQFISEIYQKQSNETCDGNDKQIVQYQISGAEGGCQCSQIDRTVNRDCCPPTFDYFRKNKLKHQQFSQQLGQRSYSNKNQQLDNTFIQKLQYNHGDRMMNLTKNTQEFQNFQLMGEQCICEGKTVSSDQKKLDSVKNVQTVGILCQKTIQGFNFYTQSSQQGNCTATQKVCDVDSRSETAFCVPTDSQCPITNLKLTTEDPEGIYTENIPILGDLKLYISRNSAIFYPLVQFQSGSGNGLCEEDNQQNDVCRAIDKRFSTFINTDGNQLFLIDGVYQKFQTIPENQENTKIYTRSVIPIALSCRKAVDQINSVMGQINLGKSKLIYVYLGTLIIVSYSVLKALIDISIVCNDKIHKIWAPVIGYSNLAETYLEKFLVYLNKFLWMCQLLFELTLIYYSFTILNFANIIKTQLHGFTEEFKHRQCSIFDPEATDLFRRIGETYDIPYTSNIKTILIILITSFVIDNIFNYMGFHYNVVPPQKEPKGQNIMVQLESIDLIEFYDQFQIPPEPVFEKPVKKDIGLVYSMDVYQEAPQENKTKDKEQKPQKHFLSVSENEQM